MGGGGRDLSAVFGQVISKLRHGASAPERSRVCAGMLGLKAGEFSSGRRHCILGGWGVERGRVGWRVGIWGVWGWGVWGWRVGGGEGEGALRLLEGH